MGRIERLWLKPARRVPMREVGQLTLVEGHGIEGNADAGRASRHVTVLSAERWARLPFDAEPSLRRANVLVSGVDLAASRGMTLRLGGARIEIRGETRPCRLMDDARAGLQDALDEDWGGGAHGVVVGGGVVRVGDDAVLEAVPAGG